MNKRHMIEMIWGWILNGVELDELVTLSSPDGIKLSREHDGCVGRYFSSEKFGLMAAEYEVSGKVVHRAAIRTS